MYHSFLIHSSADGHLGCFHCISFWSTHCFPAQQDVPGSNYTFPMPVLDSVIFPCEEGWAPKNWCFWTVGLKKTLESPLDCKEIQPVHSEGDQPWDFFGRTDAKAETPGLWPPHAKNWLIGKDSDSGRDWEQEEKGTTEDEMAGWHHWLDGHESEWIPGVGDWQGSLVCCGSWGCKESDTTEQLNWTELMVPGTEETGGLPSMGSHRVGHDWSDLATAAAWLLLVVMVFKIRCHILLIEFPLHSIRTLKSAESIINISHKCQWDEISSLLSGDTWEPCDRCADEPKVTRRRTLARAGIAPLGSICRSTI